jgi:hypothetical protein
MKWKVLEGRVHDLIQVPSRNLLGGTEEDCEKHPSGWSVPAEIRRKHLPNTSLQRYCHAIPTLLCSVINKTASSWNYFHLRLRFCHLPVSLKREGAFCVVDEMSVVTLNYLKSDLFVSIPPFTCFKWVLRLPVSLQRNIVFIIFQLHAQVRGLTLSEHP